MSAVLNDRDAILQAATVRIVNPKNAWINLQSSAPGFHLNAAGQVDMGVVIITADLVGLDDAVTFSAVGATLSNAVGRSVDVTYGGQTAIVTATVLSNGDEFKRSIVIPVLRDGATGSTTYSWIKYADTAAGGGLSNDPVGKLYIGLAHNKPTATESTTASDYTWSLIQGPPGGQGVQGQKGSDGQSLYTWIRYSDNADGTGLYATPNANTMYIGLAVNRSSATPSSTKTDYAWSKFRGADGVGTAGARGAGHYYATGSSWSDVVAQAACPGSVPVLNDVVTISSSTYVMEKRWTGSAWVENGVVINGRLIVPDSILASSIDTRGLSIKDAAGNVILSAGTPLAEQTKINPNILERIDLWINEGATWTYVDTNLPADYARNGIHKVFPNSNFCLFRSRTFLLNQNTDYTLSFKATNDGAGGAREVICDLFPDDLPEGSVLVQPGMGSYELHWRTGTQGSLANCQVRIFTGASASQLLIYDVKLERGKVRTAWNDNVITREVASTFLANAAIDIAHINRASIANLQALVAYLGSVQVGAGGALWQGTNQYNAGEGVYIGADGGGNPVLFIGTAGGANMRWSKSEGLRLDQVGLDSFTAWLSGSAGGSYPNNTTGSTGYGFLRAETSGGKLPMTYVWSLIERNRTGAVNRMNISGASSQAASFSGSGSNGSAEYDVTCVVTDGNQRSITLKSTINVNHGTPV